MGSKAPTMLWVAGGFMLTTSLYSDLRYNGTKRLSTEETQKQREVRPVAKVNMTSSKPEGKGVSKEKHPPAVQSQRPTNVWQRSAKKCCDRRS